MPLEEEEKDYVDYYGFILDLSSEVWLQLTFPFISVYTFVVILVFDIVVIIIEGLWRLSSYQTWVITQLSPQQSSSIYELLKILVLKTNANRKRPKSHKQMEKNLGLKEREAPKIKITTVANEIINIDYLSQEIEWIYKAQKSYFIKIWAYFNGQLIFLNLLILQNLFKNGEFLPWIYKYESNDDSITFKDNILLNIGNFNSTKLHGKEVGFCP
ncbi:hypothetical protein HK099_005197 [Clydaea vesicula]|uniref:Uncharacterized protein n=1 Tax=Clydaea vesicula TaxID=447962 RepID=A0AAD5TZN3_9FUNG|nr:hypothetical protein HK099_005197 [Clydaea vesicula]KAJ3394522.1 hypothetical protein HDU92_006796 [Lobulomyces angularis]